MRKYRLFIAVFTLVLAGLACNYPFNNQTPALISVKVDPPSGYGSFSAVVEYSELVADGKKINCTYSSDKKKSQAFTLTAKPLDPTSLTNRSEFFSFQETTPGTYTMVCKSGNTVQSTFTVAEAESMAGTYRPSCTDCFILWADLKDEVYPPYRVLLTSTGIVLDDQGNISQASMDLMLEGTPPNENCKYVTAFYSLAELKGSAGIDTPANILVHLEGDKTMGGTNYYGTCDKVTHDTQYANLWLLFEKPGKLYLCETQDAAACKGAPLLVLGK